MTPVVTTLHVSPALLSTLSYSTSGHSVCVSSQHCNITYRNTLPENDYAYYLFTLSLFQSKPVLVNTKHLIIKSLLFKSELLTSFKSPLKVVHMSCALYFKSPVSMG